MLLIIFHSAGAGKPGKLIAINILLLRSKSSALSA